MIFRPKYFFCVYIVMLTFMLPNCKAYSPPFSSANSTESHATVTSEDITPYPVASNTPGTNASCYPVKATPSRAQAGYRNIYPGQTTTDELINVVGQPDEIYQRQDNFDEWIYGNKGIVEVFPPVLVQNGLVYEISVDSIDAEFPTLQSVFTNYGCPDLIWALINVNDLAGINYSFLVYLDYGVEFKFGNLAVTLSDAPEWAVYFSPMSLENYLDKTPILLDPNYARQLTWDELIR